VPRLNAYVLTAALVGIVLTAAAKICLLFSTL
jgi:hypothetical protein